MNSAAISKRVVVISDLHCGHIVGLTPPQWWYTPARAREAHMPSHVPKTQRKMWREYLTTCRRLQPITALIVNGDLIDGKSPRSGGTELITPDREEQVAMAVQAINQMNAPDITITYGSPYHCGDQEDWENQVASALGARIGSHEWPEVGGVIFDCKHFISGSSVPYGRNTAINRDQIWNLIWADRGEQPRGDVILRSHVHYWAFCGGEGWSAFITPALQAAGTKFGARRMSGTVDMGLIYFDIKDKQAQCHYVRFSRALRRATKRHVA